ncbi:M48 family metallopeptidase [Arcticibacterium luteifluviistationis]|uniref:Peptidase M48 domain-containing protein n=1 Tax=Arcticibacterium luteifluviistationis TaxID=1784714 RepID=A0A2Z4G867_9BACT|nr:M48 family metallopeptidase [Arcticibacterium luteifluviistationis]AWV97336.1 hypothetical protein DJ013_03780 [Arcticibacterium luteifluviistationis]
MYYLDGQTSIKREIVLSHSGDDLVIELIGDTFSSDKITWKKEAISLEESMNTGTSILKYGDFPAQYIYLSHDEPILDDLRNTLKRKDFGEYVTDYALKGKTKTLIGSVLLFVFITAAGYFVVLPKLAEGFVMQLPMSWEEELGERIFGGMTNEQLLTDTLVTLRIDKEGSRLLQDFVDDIDKNESDYNFRVTLVKDDLVNAFALPGGRIVVFTGIIDLMNSEEELAALLSHEISHVTERHSLRNLAKSFAGYFFISILTGDANGTLAFILQNADTMNNLRNSREFEEEADDVGLELLKLNGITARGMIELMTGLSELEESMIGDSEIIKFVSTHPLSKERVEKAESFLKSQTDIRENEKLTKKWRRIKSHVNLEY